MTTQEENKLWDENTKELSALMIDIKASPKEEAANRYLLHYIGAALYTDESFKEEARNVGVNRALPPNRLSHMKWGDPILLGRWTPLAKDDTAGKVIKDKAGHDKQVLGTARLLGYTNVHGLNFDCQNREEFISKLTSQLDVASVSEGGGTLTSSHH